MILDALLELDEDMTTTTSVASTNVIDTVAAGDSYEGAWFYVQVSTAFTANDGAPTTSFRLETSSVETFTPATTATLVASGAYLVAALTAGTQIKIRIPAGAKRYIRGYKDVTNYSATAHNISACGYSMYILKDVDIPVQNPDVLA
jgi:hypothetical protein